MSEKGRIAWLDAAKGIAIAFVVAAHSIWRGMVECLIPHKDAYLLCGSRFHFESAKMAESQSCFGNPDSRLCVPSLGAKANFASFRNIGHHFTTSLIEKNIAQITPLV